MLANPKSNYPPFDYQSGRQNSAVTAGVRGESGDNPELLLQVPPAGKAEVADESLQADVLTVPSSAFRNGPAVGSAHIGARGRQFFRRLAGLRLGRMYRFAAVGAFGTVLNLAIMAVMLGQGAHYLLAAIVATELTILSNFLMQERLVFRDLRDGRPFWQRILASFGFNNIETLVRMPVLMLLVEALLMPGVLAQAVTLAVAFLVRFAFTSRVIYRARSRDERAGDSHDADYLGLAMNQDGIACGRGDDAE